MTSPTTIKRLRELLEKATPGEWTAADDTVLSDTDTVCICYADGEASDGTDNTSNDATLIAEMKRHLPALLDRVEAIPMTVQPNAESLSAAARAIAERMEEGGPWANYEQMHEAQAQAAITAFLSAERARGVELMPRDPTDAMHRAGMATRQIQDNLNKAHNVIIDTSDVWRSMFDAGAQK